MAVDATLSALADPSRRQVIDVLSRGPRRASELASELSLSRPAMSRHLRVLRRRGLVTASQLEEDARARVYQLAPAPFRELAAWLGQVESLWTEQLEAFRVHAERRQR